MISIREILTPTEYNILEELLTKVATKNVDYTKITYNLGVGEITINKLEGKESDSYIKGYNDGIEKAKIEFDYVTAKNFNDHEFQWKLIEQFNQRVSK